MIRYYVPLLAESARIEAMDRALRTVIRPGDVVVDVGTGTGAFALLAARAGASRVYAIEREEVVDLAREMVDANGVGDVVRVVEADGTRWKPPEPVDLVVFEDLEDVGLGPMLRAVVQHWRPLLAPGGRFVPSHVEVRAAPVEHPSVHAKGFPWGARERPYGLNVAPMERLAEHVRGNVEVSGEQLLAPPATLFPYVVGDELPSTDQTSARFVATRAGSLHGIAVWFDARFAPGVEWTNAPGAPATVWRQSFLHTRGACPVAPGDRIDLRLSRAPWGAWTWAWSWDVSVCDPDDEARHREERSTLLSWATSVARLRRRSLDHVLSPGADAEIHRVILECFDGAHSAREIGVLLARRFPERFPDPEQAAREVVEVILPLATRDS